MAASPAEPFAEQTVLPKCLDLDFSVDIPVGVPSPVLILAIAGAYLLKIWKVVEGLFSLSACNDVIESGNKHLFRCGAKYPIVDCVLSVPFVARIDAGIALFLGALMPIPPIFVLMFIRSLEWTK